MSNCSNCLRTFEVVRDYANSLVMYSKFRLPYTDGGGYIKFDKSLSCVSIINIWGRTILRDKDEVTQHNPS